MNVMKHYDLHPLWVGVEKKFFQETAFAQKIFFCAGIFPVLGLISLHKVHKLAPFALSGASLAGILDKTPKNMNIMKIYEVGVCKRDFSGPGGKNTAFWQKYEVCHFIKLHKFWKAW